MGLYWPNFSLVFSLHLFLYAGVYCTKYTLHHTGRYSTSKALLLSTSKWVTCINHFLYYLHFEVAQNPGHDGFKVHCGTVLGDSFSTWRQMRHPKQSHNALWQPSRPSFCATSKRLITSDKFTCSALSAHDGFNRSVNKRPPFTGE